MNKSEINALKKVIYLFLNNKLRVSKTHIKRLKKHKIPLRNIIYTKPKSLKQHKQLISQVGGSLFALIPHAISLLSQIFK